MSLITIMAMHCVSVNSNFYLNCSDSRVKTTFQKKDVTITEQIVYDNTGEKVYKQGCRITLSNGKELFFNESCKEIYKK